MIDAPAQVCKRDSHQQDFKPLYFTGTAATRSFTFFMLYQNRFFRSQTNVGNGAAVKV